MKTCNDATVGYTDHPPVGEWQGWNGGVCPVHPLATVEYVMRAERAGPDSADQLDWEHSGDTWDIIRYRIIEEYKAPKPENVAREVFLVQDDNKDWFECAAACPNATLFREVLQ